jgi:hypothetical protein
LLQCGRQFESGKALGRTEIEHRDLAGRPGRYVFAQHCFSTNETAPVRTFPCSGHPQIGKDEPEIVHEPLIFGISKPNGFSNCEKQIGIGQATSTLQ